MNKVYRVLLGIAVVLALTLAGGTLYAFFRGPSAGGTTAAPAPAGPPAGRGDVFSEAVFAGIGRIRVSTAPPAPATVIVSIAFPYIPGDTAFSEELAARITDFRRIAAEFFMASTVEELRRFTEEDIKAAILGRYNQLLRLGRIERLFFNDYMIIE